MLAAKAMGRLKVKRHLGLREGPLCVDFFGFVSCVLRNICLRKGRCVDFFLFKEYLGLYIS